MDERLPLAGIANSGLAGEPGFEPRQTESESVVLPLHHSPTAFSEQIQYLIEVSGSGVDTLVGSPAPRPSTRYLRALASVTSGRGFTHLPPPASTDNSRASPPSL